MLNIWVLLSESGSLSYVQFLKQAFISYPTILLSMQRESKRCHTYTVTSNVGVVGVKQQFVYRESECLYTSALTRHIAVRDILWKFVLQLICLAWTATWTEHWQLSSHKIILAPESPFNYTCNQPHSINHIYLQICIQFYSVFNSCPSFCG